ncbi:MAG: DMT family transporter [Marinosulfonomonas sp.]|nr:DMT family transporter [Marinosulfonomonas sp.]
MLRAAILMFIAMSLIPMGDTAGKLLVTQHGFNPFFLAWSRFGLGALMVLPFLPRGQLDPRLFLDWRIWLRGLLITAGISSILTALQTEALSTVFGAFFVGPILSFFLSAWLLKEPVTRKQTALLLLGFCGVLLVVKPGFGMTPGLGFAVLAGLFYGSYLTASRWLAHTAPPRALLLSHLMIGALVLAPPGLAHIPTFTMQITALTLFSALASMAGNLLLVMAYRMAPASTLAPFVYFQLIAATILGWAVFNDWPDAITLIGLALLISTGIGSATLKR